MKFVCDAPGGKTWFRIETSAEAMRESEIMGHSIEKHFAKARENAARSFTPASSSANLYAHVVNRLSPRN